MRRLVCVLGCVIAGLVFASAASAHTITEGRATRAAENLAKDLQKREPDYTKTKVTCNRLFPHIFACKLFFATKESLAKKKWECIDTWQVFHQAHSKGVNKKVFLRPTDKHIC